MTFAVSQALQEAIFAHLNSDPQLSGRVHDALPSGGVPDLFVLLGETDVRDISDVSGTASEHLFTISVVSNHAGFSAAKAMAGTVCDLLDGTTLTLSRGRMTGMAFDRAKAKRAGRTGGKRRIDLRFRARLDDDI
jgi:hypothetical protein